MRRSPQTIWLWRPVGLWVKQGLHSLSMHTVSCTRTQGEGSDLIGAWARATCWSWRVSWGGGVRMRQPWLTVGTETLVVSTTEYSSIWAPSEATILAPRPGPNQKPVGSSAETSQAKQPTEQEERANRRKRDKRNPNWKRYNYCLQMTWYST